jgi:hypothetical protein
MPSAWSRSLSSTTPLSGMQSRFKNSEGPITAMRFGILRSKVLQVEGNYVIGAACHGRCEHMSVLRVVLHLRDERLVVLDEGVGKEFAHGGFAITGFLWGPPETTDKCASYFSEDLAGSSGPGKAGAAPPTAEACQRAALEPERKRRELRRGASSQFSAIRRCLLRG